MELRYNKNSGQSLEPNTEWLSMALKAAFLYSLEVIRMAKSPKKKKKVVEEQNLDDILFDSDDAIEETQATVALVAQVDTIELPSAWGQTQVNINEIRKHRQMLNLKHGMFANVPMVCKGKDCPLNEVCSIPIASRPKTQRCPIEIATIIELYERYCTTLNVGPEDYFDQSQVKDLVDTEVKLNRAAGRLAISADFIEQVSAFVDGNGDAHYRPELNKATDYETQLLARKRQILGDLMATRKSKKEEKQLSDPSSFAATLMQKAMRAMANAPIIVNGDYASVDDEGDSFDSDNEEVE